MRSGVFFFFKQKTAYDMRISDWSSDVCSSDLSGAHSYAVPWKGKHYNHTSKGIKGESIQRNIEDIRAALNHAANNGRIAIRVPLLNRAIGGRVAYFTAGGPSLFQSCEEVPEPVNLRMAIEPCRTLGNHIVPHNREIGRTQV